MNPNVANKGRSFKGAIAYIIHDPDQAETDERVLFTQTRNLRTEDPEKAAKVMAYTAKHATGLKAAAGIKATGRKTDSPVYHLSLSWVPGEKPTRAEMMEAGEAALKAIGFQEHEAVFAAHGDKAHQHLHIVVNRIHPVTGKTHNPKDDQKLLQAWGHEYDKARGLELRSPNRAVRFERDPALREKYQQKQAGKAASNDNRQGWQASRDAPFPKSKAFAELKALYRQKVRDLIEESRALALRHREAWCALKDAHQAERTNIGKTLLRPEFAAAQAGLDLSPAEFQNIARSLRASQRAELRQFRAESLARKAGGREDMPRLSRNLQAVLNTPIRFQGEAHKGHLAAKFTHDAREGLRTAQEKAEQAAIEQRHSADRKTLYGRKKHRPDLAAKRRAKAALSVRHRLERSELRGQHDAERQDLRDKWASLTAERSQAWQGYEARRARQQADKTDVRDIFADRAGGLAESRRIGSGQESGGGREIARKGPK